MAEKQVGRFWFDRPGVPGDRTLDQQMQGLMYLQQSVRGRTVLDLGCAEGLITIELAKAGAVALHGVEIRKPAVEAANKLRGDLPITFEYGDLNTWRPLHRYDVLVVLSILHKLREPDVVLNEVIETARPELIAIRLPPRSDNPVVHDARSGNRRIDLRRALFGYKLIHWTAGYLNEWVGYYRKERDD